MAAPRPDSLSKLLHAQEGEEQEHAWEAFLGEFSRLVFLAARKSSGSYDDAMDRYAYVLEHLRDDDYRRLRRFSDGGRSTFTTWLVVVSSRLCVDFHRKRYGRASGKQNEPSGAGKRRRLVDLVGEKIELDTLPDTGSVPADQKVQKMEINSALEAALLKLSNEDRLIIRLRFEDQRPVREVARILGFASEFAAHRRLRAVLGRLRTELEVRGVRGPSL